MNVVDYSFQIAVKGHKGQKRWDGSPYINHIIGAQEIAVEYFKQRKFPVNPSAVPNPNLEIFIKQLKIVINFHDLIEDVKQYINKEEDLINDVWGHDAIKGYEYVELKGIYYEEMIIALKNLNKHRHPSYKDFILAAKSNELSRFAKIGDIKHNLSDLKKGSMKDKYELALYILEN